ncbi:hypothetical protein WI523_18090 [Gemmatimonadota bacterium CCK-12]
MCSRFEFAKAPLTAVVSGEQSGAGWKTRGSQSGKERIVIKFSFRLRTGCAVIGLAVFGACDSPPVVGPDVSPPSVSEVGPSGIDLTLAALTHRFGGVEMESSEPNCPEYMDEDQCAVWYGAAVRAADRAELLYSVCGVYGYIIESILLEEEASRSYDMGIYAQVHFNGTYFDRWEFNPDAFFEDWGFNTEIAEQVLSNTLFHEAAHILYGPNSEPAARQLGDTCSGFDLYD